MKQRLKFECWHCQRVYSLTRQIEGRPRLLVECPYCEHEAVVDLAPFRDETVVIFESTRETDNTVESLNLPEVLPTVPKEDDPDSDL